MRNKNGLIVAEKNNTVQVVWLNVYSPCDSTPVDARSEGAPQKTAKKSGSFVSFNISDT